MKHLTLFLPIMIIIPSIASAIDNDEPDNDSGWSTRIEEYKHELSIIRNNSETIRVTLGYYDLEIVMETLDNLDGSLGQTEKALEGMNGSELAEERNQLLHLYEKTWDAYSDLVNLYDFYLQLQDKKEEWSDVYFDLWEKTYALRMRIDKMYVKEEKMNVHYGGMDNYEYQSVRKRNLYEACTGIYNAGILELKSTGDCDHYERIKILERLIPVLKKCEKLSYSEETRDLEKNLRRADDTDAMSGLILDFDE